MLLRADTSRLIRFEAAVPFAAVIIFCLWQLWVLRKDRRKDDEK